MAERVWPRNGDEIFSDFKGRRTALIKALTTDVEEFYQQCDPESANLCLFGHPNGEWELTLPDDDVPTDHPEPTLGINFPRDDMQEKQWISLIAIHSDAWLLAMTSFFTARFGFNKTKRERLFDMINELPTVHEIVTRKKHKHKSSAAAAASTSHS